MLSLSTVLGIRRIILAACVWSLASSAAWAATYYVSPSGSASNPGTPTAPWSMSKANTSLQPGDTAILADGTYTTAIAPSNSGSAGAVITYQAENTHAAILGATNPSIQVQGRSYITVEGVKATNVHRWVYGVGSHHITLNNCYFHTAGGWESCRFRSTGGYITVTNCHIEDGQDSLHIRESDHHYVAGNTFITDGHANLIIMGIHNSVIENNDLYNAGQKCMEVHSMRQWLPPNERKCRFNLIQGNRFRTVSTGIQYGGNDTILRRNIFESCSAGMGFGNYGGTDPSDDPEEWWDEHNRFYNNVIYGCARAIYCSSYGRLIPLGGLYGDNIAVNNIIYGGTSLPQVSFSNNAMTTDLPFFYNNILVSDPSEQVFSFEAAGATYSLAEIEAAFPAQYAHNLALVPQFVDAAGSDFHLQPGSPMIDAGGPLTHTLGNGSGAVVPVADALFFTDGYGLVAPDVLRIGTQRATVVSVDYTTHEITMDREVGWSAGMDVSLDFNGSAPDLGCYETGTPGSNVVARRAFYNHSAFDGLDPDANIADDGAIAPDKQALLPGSKASFAHYTSYAKGINGIMVDIDALPGAPTAADFEFKAGNDSSPAGWSAAPAPSGITVRSGAGVSGSDRVTIIWPDNAIEKQWLQVTVLATANTGLVGDDVFCFGNAVGETGNSPADAEVTPTDEIAVRNNPHTLGVNPAAIDDVCDFNRDGKVGPTDAILVRNHGSDTMTALALIDLRVNEAPRVDAGDDISISLPTNMVSLDATVSDDGLPASPGTVTTAWSKLSGPGTVSFANAAAVDTQATFSAAGSYVLQLTASDGEREGVDIIQIDLIDPESIFLLDDFDDGVLDGWTVTQGTLEAFAYLAEPGYEVHALIRDSRMQADLSVGSLSDTVYTSFTIRHTGTSVGTGWKSGRLFFVDDTGQGFGLYFALDQAGGGELSLIATNDNGATETGLGNFSSPGPTNGADKKSIQLIHNRVTDQVECIYEGVSKGVINVTAADRDFTRVIVVLINHYDGWWGQLDFDDLRIASTPPE